MWRVLGLVVMNLAWLAIAIAAWEYGATNACRAMWEKSPDDAYCTVYPDGGKKCVPWYRGLPRSKIEDERLKNYRKKAV